MKQLSDEKWEEPAEQIALQMKIDQYSSMLYKIAYFQLKNIQDAEDVVQEVFYQYIRTNPQFRGQDHEKAWFVKVTLNACRKVFRCAWYRRRDVLPQQELVGESSLENEYLAKEKQREIIGALFALSGRYREVLHLFYFEDMSVKEIAEVTGRKESTITSQLTRGRELLKRKLKEVYQYE